MPARAEGSAEPAPLFLRIRPPSAEEEAARARAAREAVWQRSERRARIAIASVCRGCLVAPPPEFGPPAAPASPTDEPAPPLSLADSR